MSSKSKGPFTDLQVVDIPLFPGKSVRRPIDAPERVVVRLVDISPLGSRSRV